MRANPCSILNNSKSVTSLLTENMIKNDLRNERRNQQLMKNVSIVDGRKLSEIAN